MLDSCQANPPCGVEPGRSHTVRMKEKVFPSREAACGPTGGAVGIGCCCVAGAVAGAMQVGVCMWCSGLSVNFTHGSSVRLAADSNERTAPRTVLSVPASAPDNMRLLYIHTALTICCISPVRADASRRVSSLI